jgi:hypothetical protein
VTVPATVTTGSYTVSWTSIAAATSYQLEESANGGAWTLIYNSTGLSAAVSGKTAGTYSYRVKACNTGGCGPLSATASVVDIDAPASAPTVSAPSSTTSGSYTVSWTLVSGATTYSLEESANGGGWTVIYNASGTSFALTGKTAGTYSYRATACNAAGCGPTSNGVSVQKIDPPVPPVPTLTTARYAVTQMPPIYTTFTLAWTVSSGATSYELQRIAGGSTTIYTGPGVNYQYSNSGGGPLINGTMPKFSVRACNAGGCSAWSPQVTPTGG